MPVLIGVNRDKFLNLVDNYDKALGVERVGFDKEWSFIQMSEEDKVALTTDQGVSQVLCNLLGPYVERICQPIPKETAYGAKAVFLAGTVLVDLGEPDNLVVFRDKRGYSGLIEWPVGDKVVPYLRKLMEMTRNKSKYGTPTDATKSSTPFLDQFMENHGVNIQIALHRSRYGCAYALIGLHDSIGNVTESLDDNNGEGQYEVWGLADNDSWYPITVGANMTDAFIRLEDFMRGHVAFWREIAWGVEQVGYGNLPAHGRRCPITTLEELCEEYRKWNSGEKPTKGWPSDWVD